ncbi:hypothetical protein JVU11DRAFT_10795 [Chiua virens]|nr:hypothetical protein JVU11DRAFT_10795 [Chiua virens]
MPSSSASLKQAEDVLDDVLRTIDDDYARPHCTLFKSERKNFVNKEQLLRECIKEMNDSTSTSSIYSLLRRFINLAPLQQCVEDAEKLCKRAKDKINERRRNTLTGRSSPFGSSMSVDARLPVNDTSGPANEIETSPLNMRCSVSELPELNVDPTFEDGSDIRIDMNEAMSTPIRPIDDRMSDLYHDFEPERMSLSPSPLPSPPIIQVTGLGISEMPGSPRRSCSVRGPLAPLRSLQPTRQSRIHSPYSPGPALLDPAMLPSIASFPEEVSQLVSRLLRTYVGQPDTYNRQGLRANEDYVSRTNCMEIRGSTVEGLTLNNGGANNSGAGTFFFVSFPRSFLNMMCSHSQDDSATISSNRLMILGMLVFCVLS